jgi:plastocyanin
VPVSPRAFSRSLVAAVLGVLLCGTAPGAASGQAKPARPVTHTVIIDATKYTPATVTIKPGDSIVWLNRDVIPHTATSTLEKEKGGFDSGAIAPGKSWKYTPRGVRVFPYVCTFHPMMKGELTVKK